jgi:hypothetical protein
LKKKLRQVHFCRNFFEKIKRAQKLRHIPHNTKKRCGRVKISKKSGGRLNVHLDRHTHSVTMQLLYYCCCTKRGFCSFLNILIH